MDGKLIGMFFECGFACFQRNNLVLASNQSTSTYVNAVEDALAVLHGPGSHVFSDLSECGHRAVQLMRSDNTQQLRSILRALARRMIKRVRGGGRKTDHQTKQTRC